MLLNKGDKKGLYRFSEGILSHQLALDLSDRSVF